MTSDDFRENRRIGPLDSDFRRQQAEWADRARAATAAGTTAFNRLLELCESPITAGTGQASTVARLIAGLYNGEDFPIDPYALRSLDVAICDDVMACLDALRWGKQDLHTLVPRGDERTRTVLERYGIEWPEAG